MTILLPVMAVAAVWTCGCGRGSGGGDSRVRELMAGLEATDYQERVAAAEALGLRREVSAVRSIIPLTKDIHPDVQKAAITALGQIADKRGVGPLCAVVSEPEHKREVKRLAVEALGLIGDPAAVPVLVAALKADEAAEEGQGIGFQVAYALSQMGDPGLSALLAALDDDESPNMQQAAAAALSGVNDPRAMAALRKCLESGDPMIRLSGAEGLVRFKDPEAPAGIVALLMDPDVRIRKTAQRRLVPKLGIEAAEALGAIVADKRAAIDLPPDAEGRVQRLDMTGVRSVAIAALVRLDGEQAIEPLFGALASPDGEVAGSARGRLEELVADEKRREIFMKLCAKATPAHKPHVVGLLGGWLAKHIPEEASDEERSEAIKRLKVQPAIELLLDAVKDENESVRFMAAAGLCSLGYTEGRGIVLAAFKKDIADLITLKLPKDRKGRTSRDAQNRKKTLENRLEKEMTSLLPVADISAYDPAAAFLKIAGADHRRLDWKAYRLMAKSRHPESLDMLLPKMKPVQRTNKKTGKKEMDIPWSGYIAASVVGLSREKRAFQPLVDYLEFHLEKDKTAGSIGRTHRRIFRLAALRSMLQIDPEKALPYVGKVFVATLSHDRQEIETICEMYRKHGNKDAILPLAFWVKHDIKAVQDLVRETTVLILRKNPEWLLEGFMVEDHGKRAEFAGLIADEFGRDAIPYLVKGVKDKRPRARQGSVWALGCIGGREAGELVRAALDDEHEGIRSAAAWSAGRLGASFVEDLVKLLKDDPKAGPRAMAAEQLGNLSDEQAIPPLIAALADPDPQVRGRAALALALFETRATVAEKQLAELAGDTNVHVREAADYALKRIAAAGHAE